MTLGLICCLQAALSKASGALQILSSLQQGQVRGQDSWPAHELSWSCFLDGCQGLQHGWICSGCECSMHVSITCPEQHYSVMRAAYSCRTGSWQHWWHRTLEEYVGTAI